MPSFYILPNGNIKHVDGLEFQPEKDWLPTADSMEAFAERRREAGESEAAIIRSMMILATECERWAREALQ